MNSFLELHTSSDYRLTNRDYYTGTWEYINVASDYMIPFQWCASSDHDQTIYHVDTDGSETSIIGKFFEGSSLISGWTLTGTGSWTVASDVPHFSATDTDTDDYVTSNEFTLTKNKTLWCVINTDHFDDLTEWTLYVEKDGSTVATFASWDSWDGNAYYTAAATGSDYTLKIVTTDTDGVVTATGPIVYQSKTYRSGLYHWYDGSQLTSTGITIDDIFRLKIVHDTDTFYSDWMDPCGITDKTKIEISSSYDYGGIKYVDGYEQFIYKEATVRRDPKAEIEIIGDTLNGERQNEKITAAVRYVLRMKCTEKEFEALVHGMGGTLEITDKDGRVYDAQNVALADPTMYRTNGIVELSFVDGSNISVWTRNNSDL